MGTKHADIFAALMAPFGPHEVKERSENGRAMKYVTERTVTNRLDDVLGPENWWDERVIIADGVVQCRITIRLPDGSILSKSDVGTGAVDRPKSNPWKTAFSDSLKRAAVKFGVGRYLYRDGLPQFARERAGTVDHHRDPGAPPAGKGEAYEGGGHRESIPWGGPREAASQGRERSDGGQRNGNGDAPRSGKGLFAWAKQVEQERGVGLLKWLDRWGRLQEFPQRIVEWAPEQVSLAYAEAVRKLETVRDPDAAEEASRS